MQAELLETGALARAIEAVLFVASESISIKTLAKLTGAEESDVSMALQKVDADYASRGIVLREIAGGYRFATAPDARAVVERYLMPPKTTLSPAALETLAIVAYMQPVTKGDIEGIRGVSADSVLSTLVDRRFLTEAGRKDVAGRPILYKTTADFLEAFGLRSLEELPPIDIDADAPVELAFPIAVRTAAQAAVFDGLSGNGDADSPDAVAAAQETGLAATLAVPDAIATGADASVAQAVNEPGVPPAAAEERVEAAEAASLGGLGGEINEPGGGRDEVDARTGELESGASAAPTETGAGPAACDESENVSVS